MKIQQLIKIGATFLVFMGFIGFTLATETDLTSPDFQLQVGKITPGGGSILGSEPGSAVDGANYALTFVIQKLMMFIGGLALLVMSIGAGFMILHRGDDASLSKGKDIFMAGIIGLVVSLLSYLMVSTLRYLIYSI